MREFFQDPDSDELTELHRNLRTLHRFVTGFVDPVSRLHRRAGR